MRKWRDEGLGCAMVTPHPSHPDSDARGCRCDTCCCSRVARGPLPWEGKGDAPLGPGWPASSLELDGGSGNGLGQAHGPPANRFISITT